MSARNKKATLTESRLAVSEWVSQSTLDLAAEITDLQFAEEPELHERYGRRGKEKCREDAAYHLHYLAEAIAADSAKIFTDYVAWAKIMLFSRNIDPADLSSTLQLMKSVLMKRARADRAPLVKRFMEPAMQALPRMRATVPTFIGPKQPFARVANAYLSELLVFDRDRAIGNLMREIENGLSIADVFQHAIFAVQKEVGRLWQLNKISVVQEHYCTAAIEILLSKLRRSFLAIGRGVSALAVCAGGEEHSVGVKLLAELLEADGWHVRFIGAKSPTRDVVQHLQCQPTDVVAISVTTPLALTEARGLIRSIKTAELRKRPKILLGGAAFAGDHNIRKMFAADAFATDVVTGVEAANRLVTRKAS